MQGSKYSDEIKRQAAAHLLVSGNVDGTSKALKIPPSTLREWMGMGWWYDLTEELRNENNARLTASIGRVLDEAVRQLEDRVRNGDVVLDKDGNERRKPIPAKDAAIICGILVEKKVALEGRPAAAIASDARLEAIAKRLAAMPGARPETLRAIAPRSEQEG